MIPWSSKFLRLLGLDINQFICCWSKEAHVASAFSINKHCESINTSYRITDPEILFKPDVEQKFEHWISKEEDFESNYNILINDLKPYEALHFILDIAQPLHCIEKEKGGYDQTSKEYKEGNVNDQLHYLSDHRVDTITPMWIHDTIPGPPVVVSELYSEFHTELKKLWDRSHALALTFVETKNIIPIDMIQQYYYGVALCKLYLSQFKDNLTIKSDSLKNRYIESTAQNTINSGDGFNDTGDPNQNGYDIINPIGDSEFPSFDDSYTVNTLKEKIDQNNYNNQSEISTFPPKYLISTCESEINRMVRGESLLRLADIWYGKDRYSTATGFSVFTNKQVSTVQPLRADLALSMSTSMSPVDTVQIELVCHVSQMKSLIQRLSIITEVSPCIPLMNPALTAIMQPIHHNRKIYEAYGVKTAALCSNEPDQNDLLRAYASTPMFVHIDNINMSYAGPRDIRILVTLSRVLTSNSYGDRVLYCQTMHDSYIQHMFMNEFKGGISDSDQLKGYGSILNVYNENINEMVETLSQIPKNQKDNYAPYEATVVEIIDGDTVKIRPTNTDSINPVTIRLYAIDAPEGKAYIDYINSIPKFREDIPDDTPDLRDDTIISVQPFSKEAKNTLEKLLGFKNGKTTNPIKVIIQPYGFDATGYRELAEIYIPAKQTICINLEMIKRGLAYLSNADISMDPNSISSMQKYYDAQANAKSNKLGVWSLSDQDRELPSVFRNRVKDSIKVDTHKWRFQI